MKSAYLLGAGASCEALPLVSNFEDRVRNFANELVGAIERKVVEKYPQYKNGYPDEYRVPPTGIYVSNLFEAFDHLADIAAQHASVDTYARKLFLRKDTKSLLVLKTELVAYFLLAQSLSRPDKRYDHFFASVLLEDEPRRPRFPKDIAILTWNYDAQLEKAYFEYCSNVDAVMTDITQNENIFRLNGFCGHTAQGEDIWERVMLGDFGLELVEGLDRVLTTNKSADPPFVSGDRVEPSIRFAWENGDVIEQTSDLLKHCENLIIIGYSFPSFNQKIDRMLIENAKNLEKIFVQAPESDHRPLNERVLALVNSVSHDGSIDIEMIGATDLFYIPNDLIMT